MKSLVSIIIVNWNGKKYLKDCLSSLFDQNYKNIEVILVDNNSSDDSLKYVRSKFPQIIIIKNKSNLGFAEGNNIGCKFAKGKYVLFLNNDTKVTNNFLSILISKVKSNPKIGGVQSKILLMDNPEKLDSVGAFLTSTGILYHYGVNKYDSEKYSHELEIYSAKGACMLFKRSVLEKVKVDDMIFDSRYFVYFEETDLCHRVWMAGYKILFVPESVIYHKMGATSSQMKTPFVQFHSYKNRINSYIKNFGLFRLFTILPIHFFLCEILAFIYLLKNQAGISSAINKAILWNIANLNKTFQYRNFIQTKIRKLKDSEFFGEILKNVRIDYYYHLFSGLLNYRDEELKA